MFRIGVYGRWETSGWERCGLRNGRTARSLERAADEGVGAPSPGGARSVGRAVTVRTTKLDPEHDES